VQDYSLPQGAGYPSYATDTLGILAHLFNLDQATAKWYLDTCPKNDVISFFRKGFCALGLGLELAEIRFG